MVSHNPESCVPPLRHQKFHARAILHAHLIDVWDIAVTPLSRQASGAAMLLDRLFVVFRDSIDEQASDPVPLVVLEVLDFDLGRLGITRVLSIDPHSLWKVNHPDKAARVEALVDRRYDSFGRACQSVYAAYHGEQVFTVYMDRFEVYLRSPEIDPALIGSATSSRMCRGERVPVTFSPALAAARAESLEIPPVTSPQPGRGEPWEGWISVGSGQPYAHSSTPLHVAEALGATMLQEVLSAHSLGCDTHMQLNCFSRRALWQDPLGSTQRPRDFRKRSHAEANPLEEGELRDGKPRKSGRTRAKALQPGRLVFLAEDIRSRVAAHALLPRVIVSSGLQRLGGARQAVNCVAVRPLPETASLPESTHPARDVVGLAVEFERIWREHVTPSSLLEEAMLRAVELHRLRCEPPLSNAGAWKQLAPSLPRP